MGEVGRRLKKESMTDRVGKVEYKWMVDIRRVYEVNYFWFIYLFITLFVFLHTAEEVGQEIVFPKDYKSSLICLILVTHTEKILVCFSSKGDT